MIELERFAYSPLGTFGRLRHPAGLELYTVERPWAGNAPNVSCVPEGVYALEPHSSQRYQDTWALVGGTVSHFPAPGATRSAILIHAANVPGDLAGCIAPGLDLGWLRNSWAVLSSGHAMDLLRTAQAEQPQNAIRIYPFRAEYP